MYSKYHIITKRFIPYKSFINKNAFIINTNYKKRKFKL